MAVCLDNLFGIEIPESCSHYISLKDVSYFVMVRLAICLLLALQGVKF